MKRVYLFVLCVTLIFAQEAVTKIEIGRKTESILVTLFEDLPQRIEVFITADSTYIVEATYKDQKIIQRLASDEYHELLTSEPPKHVVLENAWVPYLLGQTSLGLCVYSWSLPLALGLEGDGAAAVGLFTPIVYASIQYAWAKGRRISRATADGASMGGIEGAVHGGLLFLSERTIFPFSLAENIVDTYLGQTVGFTSGMYQRKFNHCFYGYYHYAAVRTLIVDWDDWEGGDDVAHMGSLVSLGEGYASLLLSKNVEYLTDGDALFELRTALMGAEAIPLLLATFDLHRDEQSDERIYAATSLAGHILGYRFGLGLSRRYDLSQAGGTYMWLLPYLAHGATAGLGVLIDSEGFWKTYPTIFLLTDFSLTYVFYKGFAEEAIEIGNSDVPRFNISVNPLCFVLNSELARRVPFLSFSYRF